MIRQLKTVKEINFEKAARKNMTYLGWEGLAGYDVNLHLFYREKNDRFYGFVERLEDGEEDEMLVKLTDGRINHRFISTYTSIINRYNDKLAIQLAAFIPSEKEQTRSKSL